MTFTFDRFFKFKIRDEKWNCYLITDEEMIEVEQSIYPENEIKESSAGLLYFAGKSLFINEEHLNKATILHELFHIHIDYLHLSSADLDVDTFEEVIAVFLENEIDKLVKMRNKLYNKFIKVGKNEINT